MDYLYQLLSSFATGLKKKRHTKCKSLNEYGGYSLDLVLTLFLVWSVNFREIIPSPQQTYTASRLILVCQSQNHISPNFRGRLVRFPFPRMLIVSTDPEVIWIESSSVNV